MGKRIVCLGGSFDPVHNGHLIVARAVAEARGYQRVMIVPAATPPHKPAARATGRRRVEMLRLATAGDELFEVNEIELRREGPSYTLDTVCQLRGRAGDVEVHWIVGTDMLADLPKWHRAPEVIAEATIVTAARPGWNDRIEDILSDLADHFGAEAVEGIRAGVVRTPLIEISSTDIRRRVRAGLSVRYMVPEPVEVYIAEQGLYAAGG